MALWHARLKGRAASDGAISPLEPRVAAVLALKDPRGDDTDAPGFITVCIARATSSAFAQRAHPELAQVSKQPCGTHTLPGARVAGAAPFASLVIARVATAQLAGWWAQHIAGEVAAGECRHSNKTAGRRAHD